MNLGAIHAPPALNHTALGQPPTTLGMRELKSRQSGQIAPIGCASLTRLTLIGRSRQRQEGGLNVMRHFFALRLTPMETVAMEAPRFPDLRTRRLLLRAPVEQDIPAWFARGTDAESASLAGDPVPDDISAGERWLARSRRRFADRAAIQWSIDRLGAAEAIGTITLSFEATGTAALGFVLARAHWGQGLASEAAREVLRYAFETLALEQVSAEAATRNSASLHLLAKLGFRHVGSFVDGSDGERCERFALGRKDGSPLSASNA